MSYCTLPRKKTISYIKPVYSEDSIEPIISFSLLAYLEKIKHQIKDLQENKVEDENFNFFYKNEFNIETFYKIINPYEFVHFKVPNSKFSVSKIKAESHFFYILMELINSFNILDSFLNVNIVSLHCGSHNDSTIECMNIFRENNNDVNYLMDNDINLLEFNNIEYNNSIDFLYFEIDSSLENQTNKYIINFLLIFFNILNYQKHKGSCIIKINSIVHKPILDIIYLLTSFYDKNYIIKPVVSNIFSNERFIVCKNFNCSNKDEHNDLLKHTKTIICEVKDETKNIVSVLGSDLPYYFLNKIEESNIIIGQNQLEHYDSLVNIFKNKNRDDKLDTLKRNNIQKCILWCEKNKIPYNKFIDKLNIFLPITLEKSNDKNLTI